MQKKIFSLSLITTAILLTPSSLAAISFSNGLSKALNNSNANLSFRARYEGVDQGDFEEDAAAFTVKSRLNVKTGSYKKVALVLEVDNVSAFVDDYNSTKNGNTAYPVITDPSGTDVNQGYIQYAIKSFGVNIGRQRILHNNERFLGGVGWRQNEQTYDGVRAQFVNGGFSVDYGYIHNINNVVDDNLSGGFHLANMAYKINRNHKISAFAYVLDFDDVVQQVNSSATYGGLYNGNFGSVLFNASIASQSDNGDNSNSYSAMYLSADISYRTDFFTVLGGYELLGSDNGVGFNTPLATKHKFQGWSDKFLDTPGEGIQDIYFTVKGAPFYDIKLSATYHILTSDVDDIDYGNEIDFIASYKINRNYAVLAKFAAYGADDYSTDTNKFWVQATAKF